ncbi:MAG: M20/M25/M40 family metallo-hydrolase [Chloroflexota bacterium]
MTTNNPFLTTDQKIVGNIFTSREVMDNLTILCDDFGSRFGGTEGERLAAEFIKDKLIEYGLSNVHLETVDYVSWTRGEVSLEIISPIQKEIPCITLPHSPPTEMEGTLVDLRDGSPDDFDERASEIAGNIVMTNSKIRPGDSKRWIHRSEKYGRSLLAGATAFIFVNHYPAYGPATGGIGDDGEAPIPGISIAKEDGDFLQRLMKRYGEVKIRLKSSDSCQPNQSWNIIGDLPGQESPDEIVMLGSHYDGHDISQGASDPASGVVAVMEAARVLAQYAPDLPRTVRFVLWGVEEIGLLGSRAYVEAHEATLDNMRFYLNMDGAGAQLRDIVLNQWEPLAPLFTQWADEMAHEFLVGQSLNAFSDHFPFFMAGVPTGGMETVANTRTGRGYGHTRYDTLDKVKLAYLREASALSARLALRIASEADWPVVRRNEQDVLDILDGPEFQEESEFRARLEAFLEER